MLYSFWIIIVYLTSTCGTPVTRDDTNDQLQEIQGQLEALRGAVANLQNSIKDSTQNTNQKKIRSHSPHSDEDNIRNQAIVQPATPPQEHDPELEQFLSSLTAEDRALVKSMPNKLRLLQGTLHNADIVQVVPRRLQEPTRDNADMQKFLNEFSDDEKRLLISNVEHKLRELTAMVDRRQLSEHHSNRHRHFDLESADASDDFQESFKVIKPDTTALETDTGDEPDDGVDSISDEELQLLMKIKSKITEIKSDYKTYKPDDSDEETAEQPEVEPLISEEDDEDDDEEDLLETEKETKNTLENIQSVATRILNRKQSSIDLIEARFMEDLKAARKEGFTLDDVLLDLQNDEFTLAVKDGIESEDLIEDQVERDLEALYNQENTAAFSV